ncbi:MAG: cyanate hydratase, partial [Synechococcaceae cyanobacterium]|nr:cyanate hydratase [Synechococcaceae cyanobacterium]
MTVAVAASVNISGIKKHRSLASREGFRCSLSCSTVPMSPASSLSAILFAAKKARGLTFADLDPVLPADPLIYRFYEIMQVYGMPLKDVIQEKIADPALQEVVSRFSGR